MLRSLGDADRLLIVLADVLLEDRIVQRKPQAHGMSHHEMLLRLARSLCVDLHRTGDRFFVAITI